MKIETVKKLPVCARLIYWIKERYSILLRRRAGKSKPWTDDEILLKYKFCNVRRIHDRVSQWLLENWYTPYKDHPNMVAACTLARQLNNPEALKAVGFPKVWNPQKMCSILQDRANQGLTNYSGAYMIAALKPGPKTDQSVWLVANKVHKGAHVIPSSMEDTWNDLRNFDGLGSFMAGQVVADLRWGVSGAWKDKMTWAPAGPGSIRGANRLYGRPLTQKVSQEQFLEEIRKLFTDLRGSIPCMEMMDFQNCHCEFDKYERVLNGEGRPKQLYPGIEELSKLHKKQVEILKALTRARVPLTRKQISSLSGVDGSKIGDYAGPRPSTQSEKTKEKWPFPSLVDLGYVTFDVYDVNGRDVQLYCLSDLGTAAVATL